jgi:4-amino-4-deoxy-L-arabinose transferase-like glycosyltransferase
VSPNPVVATFATIAIFFAPGLLIVALASKSSRLKLTLTEQLYCVVAVSLVLSGWVGLLLAELGRFSGVHLGAVMAILTAAGVLALRKHLSLRKGRVDLPELVVALGLLGFTIVVYYPPHEHLLGGRDPGIYVNAGFHLAREGNLVYTDSVVQSVPREDRALFFVDKDVPDWSYLRYQGFLMENPDTAKVVPHGLHLYPAWIGVASSLFEMKAGLYATPFFAMMGAIGWFLALRRLFGFEVAAWAAAILTVFQIQVWFARFPNSEVVVQFLYATSLLFFFFAEERRSRLAGLLGGVALGSTFLARMETILFLVPLALFYGWKRLRREFEMPELSFLAGFVVVVVHAALHDRFVSMAYVSNIFGRHYWRLVAENIWLIVIAGIVLFAIADRLVVTISERYFDFVRSNRFRAAAAGVLCALAFYAYFVRPYWHGPRTAFQDAEAFLRMGWYLYPVGLALAVAGAMFLLVRAKKSQVLFLLVGLTFCLFFFYKVRVWHDHYFAMRRFVPVILPSLIACLSFFLVSIRSTARWSSWGGRAVATILVGVYLGAGTRIWSHNEFRGSTDFLEELSRHVSDDSIVLFPAQEGLHLLELPLGEMHGKNVLEFYSLKPPRDLLEHALDQWRDVYSDVFFVTNYKISLSGLFTRHVADFGFPTEKYEYTYRRPPRRAEPFHLRFTLSKAVDLDELAERVPQLPHLDVGGSDDLQVAWFHEKELEEDGTTYRWSQRVSSVFLPATSRDTGELVLRMAGPKEDVVPLIPVEVRVDGRLVATVTPGRDYDLYTLELPRARGEGDAAAYSILTLSTVPWRPSNVVDGAADVRELGVRLDWLETR